jgi:hypothetical protein
MSRSERYWGYVERYESILFVTISLLMLWPIWSNTYFLTQDGPSHIYNAHVLLDYWHGWHTDFYNQYYTVNHGIEPNWFSHIALAVFMQFCSPATSEKLLLTLYVLCFLLCSRGLIMHISPANQFVSYLPLLFVYHHVLQKGFYNFSFSLVWMIAIWLFYLRYMERMRQYLFIPIGMALMLLAYLSHLMGFMLGGSLLLLILLFDTCLQPVVGSRIRHLLYQWGIVTVTMLPALGLMALYFLRRNAIEYVAGSYSFKELYDCLVDFTTITNLVSAEKPLSHLAFIFIAIVILVGLLIRFRQRVCTRYDSFLIAVILVLVCYFNAPAGLAGGSIFRERLQVIPFTILPFWLASLYYARWVKVSIGLVSVILSLALMQVRLPVHRLCADAVSEYMSAAPYIKPLSTVVILNYAQFGKTTTGEVITDNQGIFVHAAEYLGATQALILLDNYEANTGYFPLLWHKEVNPFDYLSRGDGLEGIPPLIDIPRYELQSHHQVDYIALIALDSEFDHHPNTLDVMSQIAKQYQHVYTSIHGRVKLYQRKHDSTVEVSSPK